MKIKSKALLAVAGIALSYGITSYAAIQEEAVTYKDGDTVLKGYIVYDDANTAKRPGIVVVPTWWGVNKHMRDEARNYASQGYTALVADMYGDGKSADNPKDAGALMGSVRKDTAVMLSRFNAAKDTLSRQASVDASRIGAAGYSFGGTVALEAARAGSNLKGIAAFYVGGLGSTLSPGQLGKIDSKILVMNGEADPFVKPDVVDAFKKEMAAAHVDLRYVSYPSVKHLYTDPDANMLGEKFKIPFAYDPEATKQSRAEATKFFSAVFKQ